MLSAQTGQELKRQTNVCFVGCLILSEEAAVSSCSINEQLSISSPPLQMMAVMAGHGIGNRLTGIDCEAVPLILTS